MRPIEAIRMFCMSFRRSALSLCVLTLAIAVLLSPA